ncbi:hypothetical protein LCGC14_3060820, partial [marine sediment metagenome]
MGRYSYGHIQALTDRIERVENKNVRAAWIETVSEGTTGVLTPPPGGTILKNQWGPGLNGVTTTLEYGKPTFQTPLDEDGNMVTIELHSDGEWKLSGWPLQMPIGIIYIYTCKLQDFKSHLSLGEVETSSGTLEVDELEVYGVITGPTVNRLEDELDAIRDDLDIVIEAINRLQPGLLHKIGSEEESSFCP